MENKFPKRKHPRLKSYDYSTSGAYFITICTQNKRCLLSRIVSNADEVTVEYTAFGKIAEQQLFLLKDRYSFLSIDSYVIMPNHIHAIFVLNGKRNPTATIMDIICAYKSLTTRECKKIQTFEKLFQDSFYEHIVRGNADYNEIANYICNNPVRWRYDKLYSEE